MKEKIGIIGLGYVGMPLAAAFSAKFEVIGYDLNAARINELKNGIDKTLELSNEQMQDALKNGIKFSDKIDDLKDCTFYIVSVPTPIDKNKRPDLSPLQGASRSIAKVLKKGDIVNTSTKIKKVFLGTTAYDMIMTAYTEEAKKTGRKYMLCTRGDRLFSIEKGTITLKLAFEEGKNILSSNFKESVSNMVNKVLIVDENGNKVSEVKNDDWLKTYGLFQEVYKKQEDKDANAEAKAMLKGVEQTCSLSGFGDTTCITGYGVQVKDLHTGLVGLFFIDSDTHTWEGGKYTIDLELNFKNIMNEVEAGQDEKEETTSSDSNSSDTITTVTGGKEVDAEYTAYYPANNSMQGGLYDAMGNKLDPSKLTCAAPKDVAFGTKIQVKGTGTNRDGLVYKVTDRGGAIKVVNGVYKIDLLMSTKEECLKFGRRKGKAIIGVETTTTTNGGTTTASGTGAKLVELAKSKLGCKYVWGATGENTFDCSGLIYVSPSMLEIA